MSWPKDGPIHFRTGWMTLIVHNKAIRAPFVYCQAMNPIQVRKRTTGVWRNVTCGNCLAKRARRAARDNTAAMYKTASKALRA